jgi:hypothetical protein
MFFDHCEESRALYPTVEWAACVGRLCIVPNDGGNVTLLFGMVFLARIREVVTSCAVLLIFYFSYSTRLGLYFFELGSHVMGKARLYLFAYAGRVFLEKGKAAELRKQGIDFASLPFSLLPFSSLSYQVQGRPKMN